MGVELVRKSLEQSTPLPMAANQEDIQTNNASNKVTFDFILMDFFMVHMNGPEAARLIREAGYDGPIIGVTGVMGDDSTEFINNGADVVLCKPVTVHSIWKALKSIEFIE